MTNPYQIAKDQGYSDDEIMNFLGSHPKYSDKIRTAREQGYSDDDIRDYLAGGNKKKERSGGEKIGRVAGQFALGAAESALLPYEIAVLPLALEGGQEAMGDLFTRDVLSDVYPSEAEGKQMEPRELKEPIHIGVRGLTEKATELDLPPEGMFEKAAHWAGFLKDPKKLASLAKDGLSLGKAMKAISPTGTEAIRGLGAGAALEAAEQGEFGPIGTLAAAVIGDVAGAGIAGAGEGIAKLISNPKKTIADVAAKFTSKDKLALQKDIIQEFRNAGIQADLGSVTDSNIIKWTQSRLAQSGLTGKPLQEFRDQVTSQIKEEYGQLARKLGEERFSTMHEAGQIAKQGLKDIREADLVLSRQFYQDANRSLREGAAVNSSKIAEAIDNLERHLKPGSIKSKEQNLVLDTLNKIREDIYSPPGKLKFANVKELMNDKIALNDLINYEAQGGAKQLLKGVVKELDRAIISHGSENPVFAKNYIKANKRFSEHAQTFRNKGINSLLNQLDPATLMNKMNSVQGIRDLEKILSKTNEGTRIMDGLKRLKLDDVVGKNLIDSTTKQVKLGTFSKLLEKGKNREVIKEILGAEAFKRLERLQKNAGRLAESIQKFYNASQSGVVAVDAAIIGKGMSAFLNLLYGNPWPLAKIGGTIMAGKQLSRLLANPEFLKLTEDAILASEKGSKQDIVMAFSKLKPYLIPIMEESRTKEEPTENF